MGSRLAVLFAGAGLLASCVATVGSLKRNPAPPALEGTTWRLADLNGQPIDAGPARPFIKFESGHMYGFGGCNRMSGTYEITGGRLSVRKLAFTRLLCGRMELEESFFRGLSSCDSLKQEGEHIVLKQHGQPVMILEAVPATTAPP